MLKKTILMVAVFLMTVLCGCTQPQPESPTTMPSASLNSVPSSSSTITTTTIPATVPTTGVHVHGYRATVIKHATCVADGTMYFECDCGDSYTQTVKAQGHSWGQWLQVVSNSPLDPTGTYRVCSRCKAEERSLYYKNMLKKYTTLVGCIGHAFSSPSQVTAEEAAVALPMVMSVLPEFTDDPSIATRTYPVAELNKTAVKCFGKNFDFTKAKNLSVFGYGTISYVSSEAALVWTFPYGQEMSRDTAVFESYTANGDNTEFTVKFHYDYANGGKSQSCSFTVKYINNNYIITSVIH